MRAGLPVLLACDEGGPFEPHRIEKSDTDRGREAGCALKKTGVHAGGEREVHGGGHFDLPVRLGEAQDDISGDGDSDQDRQIFRRDDRQQESAGTDAQYSARNERNREAWGRQARAKTPSLPRIGKDVGHQTVFPEVIMGHAPKRCFNATDDNRCVRK